MAAVIGTIANFDETEDEFHLYIQRLQCYFVANSIEDEKKASALLALIGSKAFRTLSNLIHPRIPQEQSYSELVEILRNHFAPQPTLIVQRYRFHTRSQNEGESISEFLVELRRLASTCDFGPSVEDTLRDRFVCGILQESIKMRILTVKKLTLQGAIDIATSMELASHDLQVLRGDTCTSSTSAQVCKVKKSYISQHQHSDSADIQNFSNVQNYSKRSGGVSCHRCGGPHLAPECKFRKSKCHHCGIMGHIASVCMRKRQCEDTDHHSSPRTACANAIAEEDTDEYIATTARDIDEYLLY